MSFTILQADSHRIPLAANSVQCVVTSPPYWGLRDYGTVGQIGLEPTPEAYVEKIVAVFREVWRVLRDDGTCWVNLGDSYASQGGPQVDQTKDHKGSGYHGNNRNNGSLKPKDLVGIPWRVAFALQAAGWYLRSDIIWSKPNPMPESVTDRPTKAHEYIFLLTKRERYYFDQDAVREPALWERWGDQTTIKDHPKNSLAARFKNKTIDELPIRDSRNIRTVWEIATQPYPEAHFATFPEEIAIRCIKAGTSEKGCCAECGAPMERVTENIYRGGSRIVEKSRYTVGRNINEFGGQSEWNNYIPAQTLGWQPTCKHDAGTVPCIVLDPFSGAGTVPLVADKLNRRGIGLELKPEYCRMAHDRCYDDAPLLAAMEG